MNQPIRISASKMNDYLAYERELYAGTVTKEKLIERWTGKFEGSPETRKGTAYHYMHEHGPEKYYNPEKKKYIVKVDGYDYLFTAEDVKHIFEYRDAFPGGAYEYQDQVKLIVDEQEIYIPMFVDHIWLLYAHDFKTSKNGGTYESYFDSFQWKVYLMAFPDVVEFRYFHYQWKSKGVEREVFPYRRYPSMVNDIKEHIRKILFFIHNNNLYDYVQTEIIGNERLCH